MKRALFAFLVFALAMPAFSVFADDGYYRSTMPNGSVVFGDKPAKGALNSVFVPLDKKNQNIVAPAVPNDDGVTKRRTDEAVQQRTQALDDATNELKQAQQQLADAQAALANGQEPEPGERIGTANGTNQLSDAYFERQKQLQDAVTAAQQHVNEAQQHANDARY